MAQRMLETEILPGEWFGLYSDLYRENHDERASDGEVLADALERRKVLGDHDEKQPTNDETTNSWGQDGLPVELA